MSVRLGKRLKRAAAQAGLNQKQVAELSGVPYGWVRQVLAGGIMRPDADRLRRLASVLPVEVDELLGLSDQLGMGGELRAPATGDGDLVAAIRAQTRAIEIQTEVMRLLLSRLNPDSAEIEAARREADELERAQEPGGSGPLRPVRDRASAQR